MKHKGRNVVWSIAMDNMKWKQNRNCFNENAYTAACIAVNSRFNLNLNNQKVVNRLKTIKKRYKIMKDMLSQDGFEWNPNTKVVECDSEFSNISPCGFDTLTYKSILLVTISILAKIRIIPPLRQLPKRPRSSEALQDAMLAVASSIRRLADAMERSKCSIDASELLQAVMEIYGLEEAKPVKARAFLTYNPQMRKIYLFRQFWWWK
ncbi:hypothetical protein UlMin_024983 [Ulmus minor]